MFLQQTDEMLLRYNVFPLHDPMERFYGQNQEIIRNTIKDNIKIKGKYKRLYLDFYNFIRGLVWAYKWGLISGKGGWGGG